MSFDSGSISFQRYAVIGSQKLLPGTARAPTEAMLDQLANQRLQPVDMGVPQELEWGWSGPAHILDSQFDFEHCVFNDCIHFGLRIDTNKVPGPVRTAHQQLAERAAAEQNPSGFISKMQKRQVKDEVGRQLDDELRSGKYRRSKLVPLLWDVPAGILYGPTSASAKDCLCELFARTFDMELIPLSSGTIAMRELEAQGKRRIYEDLAPTRFAKSLEDPESPANYPWVAKGDGAKDFLGSEFMLWLWHAAVTRGDIKTAAGAVVVMFDRTLQLDCVFNQTGKDTLTATGPTRMPEAIDALRSGKVPRRAGLIVDAVPGQFNLTLAGESLAVSALRLPEIEKADTARTLFEERITLLREFNQVLDALYQQFLSVRTGDWASALDEIKSWLARGGKAAA